jgi:hypothetical protein
MATVTGLSDGEGRIAWVWGLLCMILLFLLFELVPVESMKEISKTAHIINVFWVFAAM